MVIMQRMQQRRYTAAQWTAANEVLLAGELGIELDTAKWKIGNGTTAWNALAYQPSNAGVTAAISAAVAGLVNGSPGALDTLKELADALGDDPNFAATVAAQIAAKASKTYVDSTFVTATIDGTGGVTLYLNGTEL